ncbi:kinase-like domain-containing protein [Emericellopsis atlantica]|uniref:Kinase-like domain-containing protein n=1 Tax=Emericellopsis atlantica TaxID=2614577 RepID=A0A9P7ZLL4_9HYPO|nr:kinase-like domain-containing protein [Emericellopsis atlantica]KAG9253865.1 kinase-like domain-containing protein [Emericellopsis atlantica]
MLPGLRPNSNGEPVATLQFFDVRKGPGPQDTILIQSHDVFRIGRFATSNDLVIGGDTDAAVSRNHCELYSIVYEANLCHVFVRDRQSVNGTYVNNVYVGQGPDITPGYLLEDGDVIEIKPYWKFRYHQVAQCIESDLTPVQSGECESFSHQYKVTKRCLGQGSDGSVYLALNTKTKKQLVCKVVDLDSLQGKGRRGKDQRRRKLQETDILRQLQHPNILAYVDAICSPHTLYTFTELASGGDLMSFFFRHERIPEFDTRIIIRQIVRGLSYLHSKGIVHRDLKPENVLMAYSPSISHHRIVLADFGASAVSCRSRMLTSVGTLIYQAPEIATKGVPQTSAVDIWSLGAIALSMVSVEHGIPQDLRCQGQGVLDRFLKDAFDIPNPTPSLNARKFVRSCLRISPKQRISISEAQSHPWLCTSEKHVEFFERLDERMLSNWHANEQIRPLPWDLDNLIDVIASQGELS